MEIRKPTFIAVLFLFCVPGIENKDDFSRFTSELSEYSIVKPQVINNRWRRGINRTSQIKEDHEDKVSYKLKINNREHYLHLEINRGFLHPNFVQYLRDVNGNYNTSYPQQNLQCYYHGTVDGYEHSMVALSTCSGLSGVIVLENKTFGLEPVPESSTSEHVLYLLQDSQSEPATCGVIGEATPVPSYEPFEAGQSMTSLLRRKRNLPQTSYIELVLVVDNLRYNYKKKNDTAVREEMVRLANLLDGYYKLLNIRVVLMGLEVFKDSNPFSVDGSAGQVLGEFVKWRKTTLIPKIRHDIGQLIVGRSNSYDGVLGMAFVGTVCSVASSGGINVYSNDNLNFVSTVVAHEMGHNLGMNHDSSSCTCDGNSCIMSGGAGGATQFTDCSMRDFESLILRGGGVCLRNQPSPSDVIGTPECGNGRLDQGEECDCGPPEECKNKCCDAATCKLTRGSSCAHGDCCDKCQLKVAGTQCRKSADVCDLPEYCNGKSGLCPEDFYIMDGLPCKDNAAYCYEGRCQTYEYQCLHLFGSGATKANDVCFDYENTKGNVFGNCGITSSGDYLKCTVANAKCGKVQCTNVNLDNHPTGAQISIQIVEGYKCVNADFNLGTDVLDPAYVNPGSPCKKGKTCMDFNCVNASVLLPNLNCDAQTTCNGNGVCNDQGHCHCENGWAPPNCDKKGRGGSIDSGPAIIDYSLRDGLLIFFLLVVPLLIAVILVLLYIFKRDSLDICLKRRPRSRNTGKRNTNAPTNGNIQTDVNIQTPRQVPPAAPNPSVTSAPISGFRYGDTTGAPARPTPPVQGPGVPRPIPAR